MSQPSEGEHISKSITEKQYLPPLQKQILLYLAKNQPKSRYSVSKGMKGYYKSVYNAIDDLLEKKIIVAVKEKEYRNRKHSEYWLTPAGVFIALVEDANPKTLLNKTIEVYPDNQMLQCTVELSSIIGTDMHKIGYHAILKKGKLEKIDVSQMIGIMLLKETSLEEIMKIISIMKKYPEQCGNVKELTDEAIEKLKKTELFLKNAFENLQFCLLTWLQ